jgi:VWFA-related protein
VASPAGPTITATSNLVIVPALVRGPSGDLTPALHASDFLLTDNGVRQVAIVDDTEHQPLSVVVLMQTGGAAVEELPLYSKLGTMLSYLTANSLHHVALVEFDSRPEHAWDFTSNIDDLDDGFTHPDRGDRGAAILDAVNYGIDLLRKEPPRYRRVILLLSQTHDQGSRIRADHVIESLEENNITIESISFSPGKAWLKHELTNPRPENKPYQMSPDLPPLLHTFNLSEPLGVAFKAMQKNTSAEIAEVSGGESLPFANKAELDRQLAALTNHFAATYTLSFRPTSKQPGFHSLQLRIAGHPEFQVMARTGYWSTTESQSTK